VRQKEAAEGDEGRGEVRLVERVNGVVNSTPWVLFVVILIIFQVLVEVSSVEAFNRLFSSRAWPPFDLALSIFFAVEVMVRFVCYIKLEPDRPSYGFLNLRRNPFDCLDLVLVLVDWTSIVMMDVLTSTGVSENQVTMSKMLRSARILKMLKLFRTFRMVSKVAREFQPSAQKGGGIFDATHAAAIKQFYLDPFKPNRYPGKEYSDLIIQLGFVSLFAGVFPGGSLIGFLFNVIEIPLDLKKYLLHVKRSVPTSAEDIGSWSTVLTLMVSIITVTNVAALSFTTHHLGAFSRFSRLWSFLAGQYVLLTLNHTLMVIYSNPQNSIHAATHLARQDFIVSKLTEREEERVDEITKRELSQLDNEAAIYAAFVASQTATKLGGLRHRWERCIGASTGVWEGGGVLEDEEAFRAFRPTQQYTKSSSLGEGAY